MAIVSVLMATYNGERYIEEQLESIERQIRKPEYIVISDDGSTDGTVQIARSFAARSSIDVRVFQRPARLGYAENFLSLMKECSADIIFLSDQDDVWKANKISEMLAQFERRKELLITHDISITGSAINDITIFSYFSALAESCIPMDFNVKGCSLAYKRELIDIIGWPPPEQKWAHDTWLTTLSSALGLRGFSKESLMYHRIHGSNVSGLLFTKRSGLKKIIRRLDDRLWPMSDIDRFVAHCVYPAELEAFENQIRRLSSVNSTRTQDVLKAILRKQHVIKLQKSPEYKKPVSRIARSLALFAKGNYLSSGNLSGLLADMGGLR